MDYWKGKEKNAKHAQAIIWFAQEKCLDAVNSIAERAMLYPERDPVPDIRPKLNLYGPTELLVRQCTTTDAAFMVLEEDEGAYVCMLNFASYKEPGGMFLQGSMAQEESLCHESLLYPVLSSNRIMGMFYQPHKKMLNRALYHSDILYVPDVTFYRKGRSVAFDVITCAAPNKKVAQKYQNVSNQEVEQVMRHRIDPILYAAWSEGVQVLILGAFGCGVFGNDVRFVSQCFKELLQGKYRDCFPKVVFAVPDEKSFSVMREIIEG